MSDAQNKCNFNIAPKLMRLLGSHEIKGCDEYENRHSEGK